MRIAMGSVVVSWVFVLAAGCGEDAAETPEPESAETEEQTPLEIPEGTPLQSMMHGHFQHASDAREAIIRGDIEAARRDMQWLATHDEGHTLPEDLRDQLAEMQAEAQRFDDATTLTQAGQALGRTVVGCGGCHRMNRGFDLELPPLPEGDTVVAHMQRHQWAAVRMWEGLVTADTERFDLGANALEESALEQNALPVSEDHPERVAALAGHVHALGAEAAEADDDDARADIFGRYIATCATCHRLLGVGPAAPVQPTLTE